MNSIKKTAISIALGLLASTANAGAILSAVAVSDNSMGNYPGWGSYANMIGQVNLSSNYVSGVTDFDSFVLPSVTKSGGDAASWLSAPGVYSGYITFDLGAVYNVEKLALWNGASGISASVNGFGVSTSTVSDFSTSTNAGNFIGHADNYGGTVYDLIDTSARYVRLNIAGNFGNGCCTVIGAVAFDVAAPVPEPETYAMLLAGMGVLGAVARRRKQKLAA